MFNSVLIQSRSGALDLGLLAEGAVYFGKTILTVTQGTLREMVDVIGFGALHALLDLGDIELEVEDVAFANIGTGPIVRPKGTIVTGHRNDRYDDAEEATRERLLQHLGLTKANRTEVTRLTDRLRYRRNRNAVGDIETEMADPDLTLAIAKQIATDYGVPHGTHFRFRRLEGADPAWTCESDFANTGRDETKRDPLTPFLVALRMYEVNRELTYGADGRTDLWLRQDLNSVLQAKVTSLTQRAAKRRDNIRIFENVMFDKIGIAQAVRSGERTVPDLLAFLEHAETRRWKRWIAEQSPDARLIREYNQAITHSSSLFEGLPWKGARALFSVATGMVVGLGTGGNLIAGAAASLVQEGVLGLAEGRAKQALQPWNPSLWTNGPAAKFSGSA